MYSYMSHELFSAIRSEIEKRIVGQGKLIERLLVALVADGHVLLEGVPGLAKTKTLITLAQCLHLDCKRIQFTPDLLPADITGTEIFRPQSGIFEVRKGPLFTNILLADEINRAPAKVQSALLQAMQEREVSIGEKTFTLPRPFMVLATQNPIEQDGTYPLPEAQVDRFLLKVKVDYPSFEDELKVVGLSTSEAKGVEEVRTVCSAQQLEEARRKALDLHVDPKIERYVVSLITASRKQEFGLKGLVEWGASPRGSIALLACARALAMIRGRDFVTPDEVKEMAPDVLRHRILISYEAEARGISVDNVIDTILKNVSLP